MDMVFPEQRVSKPTLDGVTEKSLCLFADKRELKSRIGFPNDALERVHQRFVILLRFPKGFFSASTLCLLTQAVGDVGCQHQAGGPSCKRQLVRGNFHINNSPVFLLVFPPIFPSARTVT